MAAMLAAMQTCSPFPYVNSSPETISQEVTIYLRFPDFAANKRLATGGFPTRAANAMIAALFDNQINRVAALQTQLTAKTANVSPALR